MYLLAFSPVRTQSRQTCRPEHGYGSQSRILHIV
jgi:hypothetical protein